MGFLGSSWKTIYFSYPDKCTEMKLKIGQKWNLAGWCFNFPQLRASENKINFTNSYYWNGKRSCFSYVIELGESGRGWSPPIIYYLLLLYHYYIILDKQKWNRSFKDTISKSTFLKIVSFAKYMYCVCFFLFNVISSNKKRN
jgi:hypothetical protein